MRKLISAFIIAASFFFVVAGSNQTQAATKKYKHAYVPYTVSRALPTNPNWNNWTAYPNSQIGWTHARINNNTNTWQNPLICAEAYGPMHKHLGCLYLTLAPMGASSVNWAEEFNVPTQSLPRGRWTVVYTYKGADGVWHKI